MLSQIKIISAACVMALSCTAQAAGVSGQGTWETTLQPRDLDGNAVNGPEAFYDTDLKITWLRDANVNGRMNWDAAVSWATGLDVHGVKGWRLPTTNEAREDYNVTGSEMGHLWYISLGNIGYCSATGCPQPGWGLTNTGDFQNLLGPGGGSYWSGTAYLPYPDLEAWTFRTGDGMQGVGLKYQLGWAMAVRAGDVAAVPEPQTYALLMLGLTCVALNMRRQRR